MTVVVKKDIKNIDMFKVPATWICAMTPTSLVTAVARRTTKINQNGHNIFERGENLLQNGILYFVFCIQLYKNLHVFRLCRIETANVYPIQI